MPPDDYTEKEILRRRFLAEDRLRDEQERPIVTAQPAAQASLFAPRSPLRHCFGCATSAHTALPDCPRCGLPYLT